MYKYLRSASLELRKMYRSFTLGFSFVTFWMALPTSPLPPVTKIIFFSSPIFLRRIKEYSVLELKSNCGLKGFY